MSTRNQYSPDTRAAAIADYYASGDTAKDVARRHGIAVSTFKAWLRKTDEGDAYIGGWENVGGVMRPLFPERRSA